MAACRAPRTLTLEAVYLSPSRQAACRRPTSAAAAQVRRVRVTPTSGSMVPCRTRLTHCLHIPCHKRNYDLQFNRTLGYWGDGQMDDGWGLAMMLAMLGVGVLIAVAVG